MLYVLWVCFCVMLGAWAHVRLLPQDISWEENSLLGHDLIKFNSSLPHLILNYIILIILATFDYMKKLTTFVKLNAILWWKWLLQPICIMHNNNGCVHTYLWWRTLWYLATCTTSQLIGMTSDAKRWRTTCEKQRGFVPLSLVTFCMFQSIYSKLFLWHVALLSQRWINPLAIGTRFKCLLIVNCCWLRLIVVRM